jgi:hypothetical protein
MAYLRWRILAFLAAQLKCFDDEKVTNTQRKEEVYSSFQVHIISFYYMLIICSWKYMRDILTILIFFLKNFL